MENEPSMAAKEAMGKHWRDMQCGDGALYKRRAPGPLTRSAHGALQEENAWAVNTISAASATRGERLGR